MYIPIILGTAREGRKSARVAKFLHNTAKKMGLETEIIDVKEYAPCQTGGQKNEKIQAYSEKVRKADALIIVTPEYNHSVPGELKLLLDSIYDEYNKKPVGICGVSNGSFGGARVVEQMKLIALGLNMVPLNYTLYFPYVDKILDPNGNPLDEKLENRVGKFFKELIWYAKTLKYGREKIEL